MTVDRNRFLRQAVTHICGSLDIKAALRRCLGFLQGRVPADELELSVLRPDLGIVEVVTAVSRRENDGQSPGSGQVKTKPAPFPSQDPSAEENFGLEAIKVINQPAKFEYLRLLHEQTDNDLDFSTLVMLLEIEGKHLGALVVKARGVDRFSKEHAELVKLLHDPLAIALSNALKHQELMRLKDILDDDNRFFQEQLREASGKEIIGADFGLRGVMELIQRVAPLDSPVLLLGETGVGKEVLANAIHLSSPRRRGPFIRVNCGAIPDTLLDSELFGHEKGAFTGAVTRKRGRFERAHGGTIFLDEIGELPPPAQVRLLHVLQNRRIERVGGSRSIPVDIRIISATHRNLEEMISAGRFREDLWFRLNVFPIMIPPLRQRREDIPALVNHFVESKSRELKFGERPVLAPGSMDILMAQPWPGNIRELENVVEQTLIRSRGGLLGFNHLLARPGPLPGGDNQRPEGEPLLTLDQATAGHIVQALRRAQGKVSGKGGAAELLGVNPSTLRKKMRRLKVPFGRGIDYR